MSASPRLASQVQRGLAWSTMNNLMLRLGSLAVGIVLARLLTPEQFGVFAVALTVQTVLMTLADLGLSADLIRAEDPEPIAPTVATLTLTSGSVLAALMVVSAGPVADLLGSPESSGAIAVLSLTLVLAAAAVVPYAMLQRRFEQKKLFAIAVVDFSVGTAVTVGLVLAGWGVMALAVGRLAAQTMTMTLQFVLSGTRPRFGWDRGVVRPVLGFGIPLAAANMLSWALLSIDNVVIARVAGPVSLGFYVLAFNISTWPMSAIGQVVRSVALPAFSRVPGGRGDPTLAKGLALTWAVALPAGAMLAALSAPLIHFLYGGKWSAAAPVLAALGIFGALRVVFDLVAAYLLARGASRPVLWVQLLWFVALIPAMIVATRHSGITGGGWAHVGVAVVVIAPAYLVAVRACGADLRALFGAVWPPLAAAVPAVAVAHLAANQVASPIGALLLGGVSGMTVYAGALQWWFRARVRELTRTGRAEPDLTSMPGPVRPALERQP